MIELVAALAVTSVVAAMVIQLLAFSRSAARSTAEFRLASGVAQGAYERARGMSPGELAPQYRTAGLASIESVPLPVPEEAATLAGARITATAKPWPGATGLRHVRVVLTWRSHSGAPREVVREGLASDRRLR
jgi:type II secretory pathway pseudopilin PulG